MFKFSIFPTLFLIASLLALCSFASAPPPACVLACVNEEPIPSDYEAVCGSEDTQSCLSSECGNSQQAAINYFQSTCITAGHQVATTINSSSSASSTSSRFSTTPTGTATSISSTTNSSVTSTGPAVTESGQSSNSSPGNFAFSFSMAMALVLVWVFVL